MAGKACFHSLARLYQSLCCVKLLGQTDDGGGDKDDHAGDDLLHDLSDKLLSTCWDVFGRFTVLFFNSCLEISNIKVPRSRM